MFNLCVLQIVTIQRWWVKGIKRFFVGRGNSLKSLDIQVNFRWKKIHWLRSFLTKILVFMIIFFLVLCFFMTICCLSNIGQMLINLIHSKNVNCTLIPSSFFLCILGIFIQLIFQTIEGIYLCFRIWTSRIKINAQCIILENVDFCFQLATFWRKIISLRDFLVLALQDEPFFPREEENNPIKFWYFVPLRRVWSLKEMFELINLFFSVFSLDFLA